MLFLVARCTAIPRGIIAYAPGPHIEARAQINVLAAVILLSLYTGMALAGGGAVVQQTCGDPFVERFRVDIPAWEPGPVPFVEY